MVGNWLPFIIGLLALNSILLLMVYIALPSIGMVIRSEITSLIVFIILYIIDSTLKTLYISLTWLVGTHIICFVILLIRWKETNIETIKGD